MNLKEGEEVRANQTPEVVELKLSEARLALGATMAAKKLRRRKPHAAVEVKEDVAEEEELDKSQVLPLEEDKVEATVRPGAIMMISTFSQANALVNI